MARQVAITAARGGAIVLAVALVAVVSGLMVTLFVTASLVRPVKAVAGVIKGIVGKR